MKVLTLILCLGMYVQVLPVYANGSTEEPADLSALFYFEEAQVYASVAKLSALEKYVKEQPKFSLSDLQSQDHPLVQEINFASNPSVTLGESAISPFAKGIIWGFCAGPVGIIVAIYTADGKEAQQKALGGALIGAAASTTIGFFVARAIIEDILWEITDASGCF